MASHHEHRTLSRPRRLIFSRKGFDSGYGGRPSPVLPDGTMVSLPIPEASGSVSYSACRTPSGESYLDLMMRLGIARISNPSAAEENRWSALVDDPPVHLDPDLRAVTRPRLPGWRALFGQVGASQTHLTRCGVGVGDLFLFFGWFAPVDELHGGRLRYRSRSEHVQAVFGWLEVGQVVRPFVDAVPAWAFDHPHVRDGDLPRFRANNTVYVSAEKSSFVAGLPGAGALNWHPNVRLTAAGATPSVWSLPECFHPDRTPDLALTHHGPQAWTRDGDRVLLRSARIGQEFVVDMTADVAAWAAALLAPGVPEMPN